MKRIVASVLTVAMGIIAAGCGFLAGAQTGFSVISSDGFPPIGPTTTVGGVVESLSNGCVFLAKEADSSRLWIVWPPGASKRPAADGASEVVLGNGQVVRNGDRVEIVGELINRAGLPQGDISGSMWEAHARFCLGDEVRDPEVVRAESVAVA